MTILVTGGTGFIGSHLANALIARGEGVKALVRKTSNVTYLKKLGVDLIIGDLRNSESIEQAMKGCDIVLH